MEKENITFLLVEPGEAGNIGAAARAMKNMGFTNLELVNPCNYLTKEAFSFAHGAEDVLKSAIVYDDFKKATENKSLVIGTSRRHGKTRGLILPIKDGISRIIDAASRNLVTITFGRENNGLFKDEISECGYMMSIPTDRNHPSLNLAQAVLIMAYEISQYSIGENPRPKLATQYELHELYKTIQETLGLLDYGLRGSEDLESGMMRNIKHMIGRYGLTEWEVNMLHGICSRIEKKVNNGL